MGDLNKCFFEGKVSWSSVVKRKVARPIEN